MIKLQDYINEKLHVSKYKDKKYLDWKDITEELKDFETKFGKPKNGSKNELEPNNCFYCDSNYYYNDGKHDIVNFIYMTNLSDTYDYNDEEIEGDYVIEISLDSDNNKDFYIYSDLLSEISDYDEYRINIFERKDKSKISKKLFNDLLKFLDEIYEAKSSEEFINLCNKYKKEFE